MNWFTLAGMGGSIGVTVPDKASAGPNAHFEILENGLNNLN